MKFPFVPRSLFDETVTDLRARLDASEADRRKLTRTIVKMKVTGGSIPRILDGNQRLEQKERNPFEKAVDANPRCRGNPALRRQQLAWAQRMFESGEMEADEIIDKLSSWHVVAERDDDEIDDDDERIAV